MRKLRFKQIVITVLLAATSLFALPQLASAAIGTKYWVQASESNTHYGCGGGILVNTSPSVAYLKATSIWATRTDEAGWVEIGHAWVGTGGPRAFYAWGQYGSYNEADLGSVTAGSRIGYRCGCDSSSGKHIFWKDNIEKARVSVSSMTSSWPATNAEKDTPNDPNLNNEACFQSLTYKTTSSGATWASWQGNKGWFDNDPKYKNSFVSATHIDVVLGY